MRASTMRRVGYMYKLMELRTPIWDGRYALANQMRRQRNDRLPNMADNGWAILATMHKVWGCARTTKNHKKGLPY